MAFVCYGCQQKLNSFRLLISHMREECVPLQGGKLYYCGEPSCGRHFAIANSLRRHLQRFHHSNKSAPLLVSPTIFVSNISILAQHLTPTTSTEDTTTSVELVNPYSSSSTDSLKHQLACLVATLYGKEVVSRNVVGHLLHGIRNILSSSKTTVLQRVKQRLDAQGIQLPTEIETVLEGVLKDVAETGSHLTTEHKRFQYYQSLGTLIMPVEILLGERTDQKRKRNKATLAHIKCTMQVVPMGRTLKQFLSLPGVLKDILLYISTFDEDLKNITNNARVVMA